MHKTSLGTFWGQTLQGLTPTGVVLLVLLGLAVSSLAEDTNQLLDRANVLIDKGNEKEALVLLQKAHKEGSPENPMPAVFLGDVYSKQQNYAESIHYREEALRRMERFNPVSRAMEMIHFNLVNDYTELGQQKYFSPELCLRLFYHLERSWSFTMKEVLKSDDESKQVEFARLKMGHYDAAVMGSHVRVQEWGPDSVAAIKEQIDNYGNTDAELVLPPDGIEEAAKLKAKEDIAARIRVFDEAHRLYQLAPSDLPLETVLGRLDVAFNQIKSIYFARNGIDELSATAYTESGWYQAPDSLKLHVDIDKKGRYEFLFRGGRLYRFDLDARKAISEETVPFSPDLISALRKPSAAFLRQYWELDVQKITALPEFLTSLYQGQPSPDLYLLTARPKNPEDASPIVKVEYTVDLDRGLQVAQQRYWHGAIGTGHKEQLATTDVITRWIAYPGGIYFPAEGWTEQMIDVFTVEKGPEQKQVRCLWRMEVVSVNEPFTSEEFSLTGYTQKTPLGSDPRGSDPS